MAKAKKKVVTKAKRRLPSALERDLRPEPFHGAIELSARQKKSYYDLLQRIRKGVQLVAGETAKLGKGLLKMEDNLGAGRYNVREAMEMGSLEAKAAAILTALETLGKWEYDWIRRNTPC